MFSSVAVFRSAALATLVLTLFAARSRADETFAPLKLVVSPDVPSLRVPEDLEIHELLREPAVANPLYLNFDERGRLWIAQYRQYPWPAGQRLVSRDAVWRNVYDPPFAPPPLHAADSPFRGRDRITIHEDTDQDGRFDKETVFLDGLNFATAALAGRGGVFVMNPPYLLFYADRDRDDVPDDPTPRVLLSGFGIEDSHSIANSLRWGPDGWIYATQGSTVSGAIVRHGADNQPLPGEKPIHSLGQNVWRYHPEKHVYEIFAEGGGNAFGVEIDSAGRVYSGHNGGDTRGFHYVQGGYYQKTFGKHGELSNRFAFGYFPAMKHHAVERFTHTFAIYEADALPERYRGKLFGVAPHIHYVIHSEIESDGSSRRTRDLGQVVVPGDAERDDWFTPVDIQLGPDGALYIADWYAMQANHYHAHEGQTNPDLGRVYRLQAHGAKPAPKFDLARLSSDELVDRYITHSNRWVRQTALRLLGDRRDAALVPKLEKLVAEQTGQTALEAFWALYLSGGFDEAVAMRTLDHRNPHVRRWTVRLLGDERQTTPSIAQKLAQMAADEPEVEVRSQLASTVRRLPTGDCLPIVAALLGRNEDAADIHLPGLLWWALEAHAGDHDAVLAACAQPVLWNTAITFEKATLPQNLMRRWAALATRADLLACARLLELAPDDAARQRLVASFVQASEGRPLPPLPDELAEALGRSEGPFATVLGVRRGDSAAVRKALARVADEQAPRSERLPLLAALGDVKAEPTKTAPVLTAVVASSADSAVRSAALSALQKLARPETGAAVVAQLAALPADVRPAAESLLASRPEWALPLLAAVSAGSIKPDSLEADTIERLRRHRQAEVAAQVAALFPATTQSAAELDRRIDLLAGVLAEGRGNPLTGQEVFHTKADCGKCHTMFNRGGQIGPDLTVFHRTSPRLLLLSIVNPSAEIREGFESLTVTTADGSVLSGFKIEHNDQVLVLRGIDGQNQTIAAENVDEIIPNRKSLMPEGLLDGLTDEELRDLFAFLASTTPPK